MLRDVFRHFHIFGAALLDRMFLREWEKDLSIKVLMYEENDANSNAVFNKVYPKL